MPTTTNKSCCAFCQHPIAFINVVIRGISYKTCSHCVRKDVGALILALAEPEGPVCPQARTKET